MLESTQAALIKYCQYQERCHSEVMTKLKEMECTTDEADEYIAWLISENILNEERFARAFARGKFRMLGWGKTKIKQHLKQKKVSDYCIRKGLSEIDETEYDEKLNKFAEKKQKELKSEKNQPTKKKKIYNFLIQKGYERDLVIYLLNDMFNKEKDN